MTPFERARDEAAKARTRLLGPAANTPVRGDQVLARVEEIFELTILRVAPESTSLAGAQAVLRRNEFAIYLRKGLTPEVQALYVAHELGHFFLDPDADPGTPVVATDLPKIAGEQCSAGTACIEAYGARERLELAANVFARELLLPIDVAREAFESGTGPAALSLSTGLPLDVVRQQMLDAVLLPDAAESVAAPPPMLTDEQRRAAHAPEQYANVIAGPGSGKTTCLVERARYLMEDQHVDPSRIAALTFTNKAAASLTDRLRHVKGSHALWSGTFHGFGLEFLRKFHHRFGLTPELQVIDTFEAILMLTQLLDQVPLVFHSRLTDPLDWLPTVYEGIVRLKEEMVDPDAFQDFVDRQPPSEALRRYQDSASLYRAYESALRDADRVDFVDLIALPARALAEDRVPFSSFIDRFEHILVDEYQDVTTAMVTLLRQFGRHKCIWVVGDLRQGIYHWRGASLESLRRFRDTMMAPDRSAKEYPLKTNHRSTAEIVTAVGIAGRYHQLQQEFPLTDFEPSPGRFGPLPVLHALGEHDPVLAIAASVEGLHLQGMPYRSQMILAKSNAHLDQLAIGLTQAGIPVLYVGDLEERAETRQLLCLMSLLADRHPSCLAGLSGDLSLSASDIQVIMAAATEDPVWARGEWLRHPPLELSTEGRAAVARVASVLSGHTSGSMPWEVVCDLILEHRVGLPATDAHGVADAMRRIALWQLAYATRTTNNDGSMRTVSGFLLARKIRRKINRAGAEREMPSQASSLDAVRLLTIHASKGLEADAVHLRGMATKHFGAAGLGTSDYFPYVPPEAFGSDPERYSHDAAIERNNLLFVALSRARTQLHCYVEDSDRANQLAPYAPLCEVTLQRIHVPSNVSANPAAHTPVGPIRGHFEYGEYLRYSMCPRRHHYSYTLKYPEQKPRVLGTLARAAVERALKMVVSEARAPLDALAQAWESLSLPGPAQHVAIWGEALVALERTVAELPEDGVIISPVAQVSNTTVALPWMMRAAASATWVLPGRAQDFKAWTVNALTSTMSPKPSQIVFLGLIDGGQIEATPMRYAYKKGWNYLGAEANEAGDIAPRPGFHCRKCGYALICPALPA